MAAGSLRAVRVAGLGGGREEEHGLRVLVLHAGELLLLGRVELLLPSGVRVEVLADALHHVCERGDKVRVRVQSLLTEALTEGSGLRLGCSPYGQQGVASGVRVGVLARVIAAGLLQRSGYSLERAGVRVGRWI